jgi:hypothetical protein
MKSMLGARLLNCLLKESVKDAPMPLTATKRALPDITIKIVNMVLSFLSLKDSNEKMKVSLIFTVFLSSHYLPLSSFIFISSLNNLYRTIYVLLYLQKNIIAKRFHSFEFQFGNFVSNKLREWRYEKFLYMNMSLTLY